MPANGRWNLIRRLKVKPKTKFNVSFLSEIKSPDLHSPPPFFDSACRGQGESAGPYRGSSVGNVALRSETSVHILSELEVLASLRHT